MTLLCEIACCWKPTKSWTDDSDIFWLFLHTDVVMRWVMSTRDVIDMQKYLKLFYVFYTFRAIALHLLYFLWVAPNTWIIALFVFIVSQGLIWIRPNHRKKNDMKPKNRWNEVHLHRIWIFVVPMEVSVSGLMLLPISFAGYLLVHGRKKIARYYYHQRKVVHSILNWTTYEPPRL